MGQVTLWRYSSTGNESTERATGRSLLVSLPHFGYPLRSSRIHRTCLQYSLGCSPLYEANFFHMSVHAQSRATIARPSGGRSELPPWTILRLDGVRVRARKSWGWWDGIEPSAGYRGMFLALLGGCRLSGMYSVLVRSLASCRD